MEQVELVWRHPNPRVYEKGPIILDYRDHTGEKFFFRPERKEIQPGVKAWVYSVHYSYAQNLLGNQPDRYFLLSPEDLIVPVSDGMSSENKVFESILKGKGKFKEPEKPVPVKERSQPGGFTKEFGKNPPAGRASRQSAAAVTGAPPEPRVQTFLDPSKRPQVDE